MTWRQLRDDASDCLRRAGVHVPSLVADILLKHTLAQGCLEKNLDLRVPDELQRTFNDLLKRRLHGEPISYALRRHTFWQLAFEVTPDVLIPRPSTELVLQVVFDRLYGRAQCGTQDRCDRWTRVADVGTGCGCIAVVLARQFSTSTVYATDISFPALVVARRNAARHGVDGRTRLINCSLLEAILRSADGALDLVVSNLPYVGRAHSPALPREVRDFEPALSLYGGDRGFELFPHLVAQAAECLRPGGLLVLELGENSLPAVRCLSEGREWRNVAVTLDSSRKPRVISAERN